MCEFCMLLVRLNVQQLFGLDLGRGLLQETGVFLVFSRPYGLRAGPSDSSVIIFNLVTVLTA